MNKKLPIIITISILVIALIAALAITFMPNISTLIGGSNTETTEPVSLNVWGVYESPEVYDELSQNYQIENPNVSVIYDDRSILTPSEYKERIFTRLSAGSSAQDIVLVHNSWVPELSQYLSSMPQELLTAEAYSNNFYSSASQSAILNNNIYAVPAFYDGLVLVYNREHFEEIDQLQAPTTWEEFRRIAIDLTIRGSNDGIVRSGAAIGNANNIDFASDILGLLFSQTDVSIPSTMDSRAAQDALSFYTSFVTEYEIWNDDFIEASSAFVQGQVSMIFVPTWNVLDIIAANPELDVGVAPVPQALPDEPISWGSFWMYAVPESSQNKRAAWEFINYISQSDQQKVVSSVASRSRQFPAPYALKSLANAPEITNNPYLESALTYADNSRTGIITSRAGNLKEENIMRDVINSVVNPENTTQEISFSNLLRDAKNEILR